MRWREWLEKWSMTSLKIKPPFLEMDWSPNDSDRNAAWELYTELLTRITTQNLPDDFGDEQTALESIYNLFAITREIIKRNGRDCIEFTKIAIVILNQIIRPFTSKWHRLSMGKAFDDKNQCIEFRNELSKLQVSLNNYTKMLSDMANVEDLTSFEDF